MTNISLLFGSRGWMAALVISGAGSLAVAQGLQDVDVGLFRTINGQQDTQHNGFFEYLDYSSIPTFVATPVGFVIVGVVADDPAVVETGILSGIAQGTSLGITIILKELTDRPRPFSVLSDVKSKHLWSATGASFPSGHSSQAFSIATVFSLKYQKLGVTIPVFLWATAIGYGRIFLGLHFPSDVLGGAMTGVVGGFVAWSLRARVGAAVRRSIIDQKLLGPPNPQAELFRVRLPL